MKKTLIKNKSAQSLSLVVQSILLVAVIASLVFVFNKIRIRTQTMAEETECIASIEAHASFVESQLVTKEVVGSSTAGIGSFFIDSSTDPPPIKCDTKIIKSKEKTKEKIEEEIISSAVKTWFLFKEGKKAFYPGLEKKNFCFVKEVIEFKEIPESDLLSASQRITMKQILKSYEGPEIVFEYFDEYWKEDDHILGNIFAVQNNFLSYYQIYYPGNTNWYFEKLEESRNFGFIRGAIEGIKDSLGSTFVSSRDILKVFNAFFDNLDVNSFQEPPDTNVPYAVIFFQTHDYPSNWADLMGDEFYPFIFSAVMVIPYTEDAMSQIQCEYLPAEFQN